MKHLHLSKHFNFFIYHLGNSKLARYLDNWALRNLDDDTCLRYLWVRGIF